MRAGLLGQKLPHTFSPEIHSMLGDYSYEKFEVEEANLAEFLREGPFDGINVTIPYKKAVLPFLSALSQRAEAIGSVNTICRRKDGTLFGDNTDIEGFLYLVRKSGIDFAGRKVLVLGTGGSGIMVRAAAEQLGARAVVMISRSGQDNYTNLERHADAEVIVNTTPVGMYPNNGECLLNINEFKDCKGVIDIIYNPAKTKLLLDAERFGIRCANGLTMLVAQAKAAAELFTGHSIDDEKIEQIVRHIEKKTKNIILIGMPGCGKTTIGRVLADLLGRPFIDCDEQIIKTAGCSIPDIFEQRGEAGFRALETQITARFAKESGLVIATGGGVVTRAANHDLLRQNAFIIHLERTLNELDITGRPLSLKNNLEEMASVRMPMYQALADFTVSVQDARQTAQEIVHLLG